MLESDVALIQKPFTPSGLINKVREVLGNAAWCHDASAAKP
jgi:hypothetical protein